MNLYSAMAESSDIYFYYVGGGYEDFNGLGADKIIQYYRKFGLGSKTGIDLPTEAEGLIPTPAWKEEVKGEEWYLGDTYHISIGQGDLLTTPLQVLSWTATVANGGQVLRPYLVKEGVDREKNVIFKNEKNVIREGFISDEYIDQVKRAMRETVLSGSGKLLSGLPVSSAGKTGTAQHGGSDKTHAWYTAYAPYEDPEIALVVLIEEGGEGHDAAVPVANDILKWYFENKKK
jgi:penicillin-binding protein 2